MTTFEKLYRAAAKRKGGPDALEAELPSAKSPRSLKRLSDAELLSSLAQGVFSAGFVWRVVEAKWEGTTEAFWGFDPFRVASMSDKQLDKLVKDERLVRNRTKIIATRDNARMVLDLCEEYGSFAKYIADWPTSNLVGLFDDLKKRGSRTGGMTGPYFLRRSGKDTFLLTSSVVAALKGNGVISKDPTSKRDKQAVQEAFNAWHEESGRAYCEISKVLACTVP